MEPSVPGDGGFGRLIAAVWRRRFLVLLGAIVCGAVAGGLSVLRSGGSQSVVQIRVGAIAPVGFVEQGDELAQRLSSLSAVLELAGISREEAANAAGCDPKDLRAVLLLGATVHGQGRLVQYVVEAPSAALAERVARGSVEKLTAEHDAIFEAARKENIARIAQLEQILQEMQQQGAPMPKELDTRPELGRWTAMATLAKDIAALKEANLPPKAFPTRVIAGPDTKPARHGPSRALTILLGLFTGAVLAMILVIAAEAAAPYLAPAPAPRE